MPDAWLSYPGLRPLLGCEGAWRRGAPGGPAGTGLGPDGLHCCPEAEAAGRGRALPWERGGGGPAPVGGGAGGGTVRRLGEGPEGARGGQGWRGAPGAPPPPSRPPGSGGSLGDPASGSPLRAGAPVETWPPTPCAGGAYHSLDRSLPASVSLTLEWRGWTRRFSCTLPRTGFLWLWDRAGRIQGWVISHPFLRGRPVLITRRLSQDSEEGKVGSAWEPNLLHYIEQAEEAQRE